MGARHIRVPDRSRGVDSVLHFAAVETCDRTAVRTIHLQSQQLVTIDPYTPRGVHLGNDSAVQFENRVGSIVGCRGIAVAIFIYPLRDMGGAQGAHCANRSEEIVEDIAPVTEHIDDDTAPILLPVVPGRALCWLPVSLKYPISEFSPNREDPAKETVFHQSLQFSQTG